MYRVLALAVGVSFSCSNCQGRPLLLLLPTHHWQRQREEGAEPEGVTCPYQTGQDTSN
jgi:hypothetical protein